MSNAFVGLNALLLIGIAWTSVTFQLSVDQASGSAKVASTSWSVHLIDFVEPDSSFHCHILFLLDEVWVVQKIDSQSLASRIVVARPRKLKPTTAIVQLVGVTLDVAPRSSIMRTTVYPKVERDLGKKYRRELTWCTVFSYSLQSVCLVVDMSEKHGRLVAVRRIPGRRFKTVESFPSHSIIDVVEDTGKIVEVDDRVVTAVDRTVSSGAPTRSSRTTFATEVPSRSTVAPLRSTHTIFGTGFEAAADSDENNNNNQTDVSREHRRN